MSDDLHALLTEIQQRHDALEVGREVEVDRGWLPEAIQAHVDRGRLLAALASVLPQRPEDPDAPDMQLLAWAVTNCHMLARRALARSTSVGDREKWEHVLRICEKAGARSQGVLRASLPTEMTEGGRAATVLSLHRCRICWTRWLLWPAGVGGTKDASWNLLDK